LLRNPARRYHARLFSGHTVDLPLPDTAGIVMTVQPVRDDSLAMQLYFPPETVRRGESFHLVAQSRGVYAAAWEITATRPRIAMRLPVDQLQTGIARFTLFTGDGIPCNERLVFVDKEDEIQLKVKPLPPTYKGRGSVLSEGTGDVAPLSFGEGKGVRLLLHALDAVGLPVQGVFTVSVTDSLYGSHDTRDATLRSQMLLSSDLKGKVENPGWYFRDRDSMRLQALDLVMQTHGWSGYSWDDAHNTEKSDLQYTPELDYRISGRVTNLRGAVAKDVSVTYLAQGAITLSGDTVTDAQGRFGFDHLLPLENTVVSLIAKHRKGKRNALGLGIELDRQPQTPSPPVAALPRSGSSAAWEELLAMYRMQKQSDEHWLDSLLKRTDTKMIKEVTIEAKRPVKGSYNLNGPGQADHVLYEEDIARYDKYDRLLDILKAEFPQFKQENWELDEVLWKENEVELGKEKKEKVSIREEAMNKINQPYPIWRYENRTVCLILNGRILPVGLPADDALYLRPHPVTDSLQLIAINFWNIPATDITGIEILDSPEYIWAYADCREKNPLMPFFCKDLLPLLQDQDQVLIPIVDKPTRPLLVEVTTRSGRTHIDRTPTIGLAKQSLRGFAILRAFYVPKYYPDNMVDRAEYDVKPTLYWNPEVVTDREGKAEITFPIGFKPRGLQIRVEGTDLQGRIGSMVQGISVNEGNNHNQ
jgi:hypothetical protein